MDCLYFQHCILDYYSYQIWKSIPRVPSDIQIYPKENIHLGALLHKLPSTIWIHLTSWKYFYVSIRNYMVTKSQVQWVTKISEFFSSNWNIFLVIFDVFFSGSKKSLQNCNFRSFAFWLDNITILLSSGKSFLSCFALVKMLFWNILNFIWTSSLNCIFR